tara:strand:- start:4878 stop:5231 length:354 start_codon:yes stop_codon:yes gene_type:complete
MNKEEKFVDVNGFQVMDLTPDMHRALALVDLEVLIKLTSYLETANVYTISSSLREEIRNAANKDNKEALQAMVHICAEFVAFHKTVNLIKEVKHPMNVTKHHLDDEPVTGTDLSDLD